MFVKATKDYKSGRAGCYCSLVETVTKDGGQVHRTIYNFGFLSFDRVPHLKAALNSGDPDEIYERERAAAAEDRARALAIAERPKKARGRKPSKKD